MATIEVCARKGHAYAGVVEKAHSYIVITYDDGSQYYVRAGGEDAGGEGSLHVTGEYGAYVAGTIDWDAEGDDLSTVVFTGTDAEVSAMYSTMTALTDQVNAALYPYVAGINDCNAFSGTMLDAIGLPRTVPMNTDGYTIWCPAFLNTFTYQPGSRFPALLGSRLAWAEANNIEDALGAAVFFAEAFIKDPWPGLATAQKTATSLAELDAWLESTAGTAAATGSNNGESLTATESPDVIAALAGADTASGLGGDDLIYGGQGIDTLSGGAGNDFIDGGVGPDKMSGGAGDDVYIVDNATDVTTELAGEGVDTVKSSVSLTLRAEVENLILTGAAAVNGTGNALANSLVGNAAANVLAGGSGNDMLSGNGGNDVLTGGTGVDTLDGGAGTDAADYADKASGVVVTLNGAADSLVTVGGVAEDTLRNVENVTGGAAGDALSGDTFANTLAGGGGDDLLKGGGGLDTLDGGAGTDTADYSDQTGAVAVTLNGATNATATVGGVAEDTLRNVENVTGGSADDALTGDGLANLLSGGGGNDALKGGGGLDTLDGGAGSDTADYSDKSSSVAVTLNGAANVTARVGGATEDTLRNVENLSGGSAADTLTGDGLANLLSGGGGDDLLNGHLGRDVLDGGAGRDIFLFNTALNAATNVDTVAGFSAADDTIQLENAVFTALGKTGTLATSAFHVGTAAQDRDDRIVYDPGSGAVLYDADGTGAAAAVQFATLSPGLSVTAADFFVV